uniref:AMP-activated protein kinase glycogen-binding domain-containing protein n=1 Tax=Compsopogon caeruleus TaxID=31354 RepID=A0A7S1XDG6_9RHOD|mmetsp:Transcript_17587/g.36503  ORF Transcript_17587/g.36503 Transcript_17587/m.36503 type:complete len:728 (+) Transcript_17587:51-2234(+)
MEGTAVVRRSLVSRLADVKGMESTASYNRFSVRQQSTLPVNGTSLGPSSDDKILTVFVWKEEAKSVHVSGSFNGWKSLIPLVSLQKDRVKEWVILIELVPGDYLYRFMVDGEWRVAGEDPNLVQLADGMQAHWLPVGDDAVACDAEDILQEEVGCAIGNAKEVAVNLRFKPQPSHHQLRPAYTLQQKDGKKRSPLIRTLMNIASKVGIGRSRWKNMKAEAEELHEPESESPMHHALAIASVEGDAQVWFPDDDGYERVVQNAATHAPAGAPPCEMANLVNQTRDDDLPIAAGKKPKSHLAAERNAMERQEVARRMFLEGNFDSALALYRIAIRLREENNLKMSPSNVFAHLEMGTTLFHLDEFSAAEQHFRIALAVWQHSDQINFVLEDKQRLGDLLQFLGVALDVQRKREESEYFYQKAIEKYEEYGVEGPNVDTCRENLELVRQKLRKAGQATGVFIPKTKAIHLTQEVPAYVKPAHHLRPARRPIQEEVQDKENSTPNNNARSELQPAKVVSEPLVESPHVEARPELKQTDFAKSVHGWSELAKRARENMPEMPLPHSDSQPTASQMSHEKMVRQWHTKATAMRKAGQFGPASDLYLIAVFARRKGGIWYTDDNINMLIEYGRMLMELDGFREADQVLGEAINILRVVPTHRDKAANAELYRLYAQVQRARGRHSLAQHSEAMATRYSNALRNSEIKRQSILESRASISRELRRAAGLPEPGRE